MRPTKDVPASAKPAMYRIRVLGTLDTSWATLLGDMTVTHKVAEVTMTTLTGLVADQAALRGLLAQIWDLNLTVVSVERDLG
jgi:hypothetical protein